jgi:hypothetical protein
VAKKAASVVRRVLPSADAWPELVAGIPRDAARFIFVGVTGSGKTTAIREFLGAVGDTFEVILVHDQKRAEPEFPEGPAIPRASAEDVAARSEVEGAPVPLILVVRGQSVDDLAGVALQLGNAGIETLLVVGELSKAVTDGGRELTAPNLRTVFLEGRARHVSVIVQTQMATRVPGVLYDNAKVIMFNPGRKALNYLADRSVVGSEEITALPGLAVMDQGGVGEFIVVCTDRDWDRRIYAAKP